MVVKTNKIIIIYFIISIIIFSLFMSESSYLAENIIVPYVKISPIYIHFAITIVIILLILLVTGGKRISIDIVFVFLVSRIVISILPALYSSAAYETIGRVTVPIISALAYFIGIQYRGRLYSIVMINVIFGLVLSFQTIYTVLNMEVPHISLYAQYIKIPIGSSNLIAAYIVPCMFLLISFSKMKGIIKLPIIIVFFISIIGTTSIGAILITAIMSIMLLFFSNNRISKKVKIISLLLITLASTIYVGYLLGNGNTLDDLTHNRYSLFIEDIKLWSKNILLGIGMVYEGREAGTHNILVDLLVQGGIIGFFAYIIPLSIVFKIIFKNKDKVYLCVKLYLVASFLHSLIETSYFNYINDMLFWFMSGITLSLIRNSSKNYLIEDDKKI